jgi:hypothetical protein
MIDLGPPEGKPNAGMEAKAINDGGSIVGIGRLRRVGQRWISRAVLWEPQ